MRRGRAPTDGKCDTGLSLCVCVCVSLFSVSFVVFRCLLLSCLSLFPSLLPVCMCVSNLSTVMSLFLLLHRMADCMQPILSKTLFSLLSFLIFFKTYSFICFSAWRLFVRSLSLFLFLSFICAHSLLISPSVSPFLICSLRRAAA